MKRFDRKFGVDFLRELPQSPAVYLFKDEAGEVIYTGKAKNIRRRLSDYRNASRRKAHRKMRAIVREAHSVEIRLQPSEAEALLVENQLIRELRPPFNVDGAFEFLYPAIGVGIHEGQLLLAFSSAHEIYENLGLSWHGTFRARRRASEAFESFVSLFGQLGHVEPRSRLPEAPRQRGSRLVLFRRVPPNDFLPLTRAFLDGEGDALLGALSISLLEQREARRLASEVEDSLRFLAHFYRQEIQQLREVRLATAYADSFVPRTERDRLFIKARNITTEFAAT